MEELYAFQFFPSSENSFLVASALNVALTFTFPVVAEVISAVAAGAKVLFFEIHPNPEKALCDGDNMLPLGECEETLDICNKIFKLVN